MNYDKEWAAESLITLAKEHKRKCDSPDCGVSLYMLGKVYKELVDRNLTDEEWKVFV